MDTKALILDAAEALFAEQGFGPTSLRNITARAGVNLAAVNYHFGSKEALVEAIFARRVAPMNRERLRCIDELESRCGENLIPLSDLIRAFIGPVLELSRDQEQGGARFIKLLGRSYTEPQCELHGRVRDMYDEVSDRFRPAFARALPHLPPDELYWRLHFLVGVLSYCMAGEDLMRLIASCRRCDPTDTVTLMERLVAFLEAGLRAPVPQLLEEFDREDSEHAA